MSGIGHRNGAEHLDRSGRLGADGCWDHHKRDEENEPRVDVVDDADNLRPGALESDKERGSEQPKEASRVGPQVLRDVNDRIVA